MPESLPMNYLIIPTDAAPVDGTPIDAEPQLTEPQLTEPQLTLPQFTEPQLTLPQLTEPQLTLPQLTEPQLTLPPVDSIPINFVPIDCAPIYVGPINGFGAVLVGPVSDEGHLGQRHMGHDVLVGRFSGGGGNGRIHIQIGIHGRIQNRIKPDRRDCIAGIHQAVFDLIRR